MNTAALALALALMPPPTTSAEPSVSLDDLWRFPRAAACAEWVKWGRAYQSRVWEVYMAFPQGQTGEIWWDYYTCVQRSTDAWEKMLGAWDESKSEEQRRSCLRQLRLLIGEQQYFCGFIPVPLDLRFFWMEGE